MTSPRAHLFPPRRGRARTSSDRSVSRPRPCHPFRLVKAPPKHVVAWQTRRPPISNDQPRAMKDKTVAILESRAGDRVASLIRKYGGTPLLAPALAEVPDVDPERIRTLVRDWELRPPDIFVFQTGVGTRALFDATDAMGLTPSLLRVLESSKVV